MSEIERLRAPDAVLAGEVSRRYYLEDQSMVEIAAAIGVSRFKVARLLKTARASGMVRIEVLEPMGVDSNLSATIRTAFALRRCIVVACDDDDTAARSKVGSAGGQVISDLLHPDHVLGLPWSRTVALALQSLTTMPPVPVVQLSGSLATPLQESSVDIVRRASGLTGAQAWGYYAPLILDDVDSARAMRRQPAVKAAMEQVPRVTIAVLSVGAWASGQSTIYDAVPQSVRAEAARLGVVGESVGVFFDADGAPVRPEVSDRMVTITGEQLIGIPEVVALATGAAKAPALRAFLRGGYASSLVIDRSLATALLTLSD